MDLNSDGKTIGTIIITIIFLIGLIIIIDEIYNLTKFAYRYTYLYNYGNMNEKICDKNKLEYETARFRIYNEINKYKLEKDIFNKTWLNYLGYITVFILSILLSISFGYLFYHIFINNNPSCNEDPNNMSILKQIMQCLCADCHTYIPNCFINYFMLFVLIVIYPLIYILKLGIKLDLTWNSGYYTRLLHILFFIGLVYYIMVIFIEKSGKTNEEKYNEALIYTFFIIIFYMNNYIFNKTFDEFNSVTKVYNLYNNKNESLKEADTTFFDVYKQEEPLKPISIDIPYSLVNNSNLLQVFKYCKQDDFKEVNTYCNKIKEDGYKKDKEIMDRYYKQLENYENDMKIYKDKYNIYQNNKTNFPDVVYILYTMLPKLTGIQKREVQILFVLLIILIIITYYLKVNNNQYGDYVFYTAFLYVLGILSIIIITNAVLNYNTYVNKYLIYEPINNYKNCINNKNTIFNLIIKKDQSLKEFYKKTSGKLDEIIIGDTTNINIDELIKKIKDKNEVDNTKPEIPTDKSILSFQLKFYKTIYSYTIVENIYTSKITNSDLYNKYNNYYTTEKYLLTISNPINIDNYNNLIKYVKLLLLNDENAIKERIKQLKINFKFYVYNKEKESVEQQTLTLEQNAIKKKKDIREKSLNEIEEQLYNQNLFLIDKAFDVYEELLIDCRKLFIELFNNLKISCDYTNFINVDEKIAELDNKLLKNKSNFKDSKDEPAIIIYKKIIENTISKLDMSLRKHINIIKIYVRLFQTVDTAKNKKPEIINKIINNYNLFANDEDKHTANDFYKILIELKSNFMSSKYNTLDSLDLKKLNISTNNVSWSFVILIIIFAIILLEPLIV